MSRQMTCIACPRGCLLTVTSGDNIEVSGYGCLKGVEYGRQEILQPMRMLTTTVRTDDADSPRLPVRLSAEIPKDLIFECMKVINRFTLDRSAEPGDVLLADICGSGADLISAGGFKPEGVKHER